MMMRALVVGGTNGIGYAMACRVAAIANSSVTISGRTEPAKLPCPNMHFLPLEATSMRQIKQYTDQFKSVNKELDLLIMTQGIMTTAGRTETSEGIDRRMALHYYGKQLLVRELMPILKKNAKVVIVFDGRFGNPKNLIWDDLDLKRNFSLAKSANHCMVMNDAMIQYYAAQQETTRHFIHAWPGGVNTSLYREMPWYLRPVMRVLAPLATVSPDVCAENLLKGVDAVSLDGQNKGRFWSNIGHKGRLIETKAVWTDEEMDKIARHTWELIDRAIDCV